MQVAGGVAALEEGAVGVAADSTECCQKAQPPHYSMRWFPLAVREPTVAVEVAQES